MSSETAIMKLSKICVYITQLCLPLVANLSHLSEILAYLVTCINHICFLDLVDHAEHNQKRYLPYMHVAVSGSVDTCEYNVTSDWTLRICDSVFCDIPSEN